jgi:hypothetical protein
MYLFEFGAPELYIQKPCASFKSAQCESSKLGMITKSISLLMLKHEVVSHASHKPG